MRILVPLALVLLAAPALAITPGAKAPVADVWQPAPTPTGGLAWAVLESTKEVQRTKDGVIYSRPAFPPPVKALAGKRVRVSGWMMPLQNGATQRHFVLLGYPPGCPFHMHAGPTQFIEVKTAEGLPVNYEMVTVEGTLTLLGEDESGIFYRIADARRIAA